MLDASISLVSRDRPELLDHALGLVSEQDYPQDKLEVLLVDSSQPPLESFIRSRWQHRSLYPKIRYFYLQEPVSIGEKRNFAARHAKGSVIVQWDDDDYYGPTRLREQIEPISRGRAECTALTFGMWYFLEEDEFWFGPPAELGCGLSGGHPGTLAFKRSLWSSQDVRLQYPSTNFADPDDFQSAAADILQARTELIPSTRVDFIYVRHKHAAAAAAGSLKLGLEECFLGVYYEILTIRAFGTRVARPTFLSPNTLNVWAQARGSRPLWSRDMSFHSDGLSTPDRLCNCTTAAIEVLHGHLQLLSDDDLKNWLHGPSLDGSRRRDEMKKCFLKGMMPALITRLTQLPNINFKSATVAEALTICTRLSNDPGFGPNFQALAKDLALAHLVPERAVGAVEVRSHRSQSTNLPDSVCAVCEVWQIVD